MKPDRRIDPQTAYRVGACIFYYRELENEKVIPFVEQVLYQDEHILVADKPHFLPVIPSGRFLHQTLLVRLRKNHNLEALVPIHRLDRETAGVVLFSVNPKTRGHYTSLFRNRKVRKVYEALAPTLDDCELPDYSAESHCARRTILSHEGSSGRGQIPRLTSVPSAIWDATLSISCFPLPAGSTNSACTSRL